MTKCAGDKRSHLQQAGESYTQHGMVALTIAYEAAKIAAAMVVHAALPHKFVSYGSDNISKLYWFVQLRKQGARRE